MRRKQPGMSALRKEENSLEINLMTAVIAVGGLSLRSHAAELKASGAPSNFRFGKRARPHNGPHGISLRSLWTHSILRIIAGHIDLSMDSIGDKIR